MSNLAAKILEILKDSGIVDSMELNYITNPSGTSNTDGWSTSAGAQVTVVRTTTLSELPRPYLTGTGLKIVGTTGSTGQFVKNVFVLDESDLNKMLKIEWDQKPLGSYADGELLIRVRDIDKGVTITPSITEIPSMTGKFQTVFATDPTSINYEIRITGGVDATDGIVISNVIVGPGSRVQIPDPRWPSYDESEVSFTGNTVSNAVLIPYQDTDGLWRVKFAITSTSAGDSSYAVSITGTTIDKTEAIFGYQNGSSSDYTTSATTHVGTNELRVFLSAPHTTCYLAGDVSVASKPTFATKSAPDLYLSGMPDTDVWGDWEDFTPSASAGFSGTFSASQVRRDGPDLLGKVVYTCDGNETGSMYINPPNSLTINETALTLYGVVGKATIFKQGSSARNAVIYWDSANNRLTLGAIDSSGTYSEQKAADMDATAVPFDASSGDTIYFDFRVPIQGWTTKEYLANAIVGFNLATEDRPGLVKKNKVQSRFLTAADINADTTNIGALGFAGLTVGKLYRCFWQVGALISGNSSTETVLFTVNHDSTVIGKSIFRQDSGAADARAATVSGEVWFTATATTLTFNVDISGTAQIGRFAGDQPTYTILEEINSVEVTTDFTP